MEFFTENIALIILLPLWLSVLILIGKFFGISISKKSINCISVLCSAIGIIFSAGMCLYISGGNTCEFLIPFISIKDFSISLGIYADKISAVLVFLLYVISLIIQIYSISYMREDKSYARFFALINLFIFSMSAFLLSPNLYQFYIFWELIGVSSYLLIGLDYNSCESGEASKKVFIINRVGDCCLLLGVITSSYFMYIHTNGLSLVQLPIEEINLIASYLYGYTTPSWFLIISLLFVIASLCKSAQYPFSSWLIHAMTAPIPVSALIHSATMVTAGAYLFLRLVPLFQWCPQLLTTIIWFVLFSAIITSISAITQTDGKKILAYSTSAQLGIMLFIIALGYYQFALLYLIIHALVKSMLFLSVGIIGRVNKTKITNIFEFSALRKYIPICCVCFAIALLSMSGTAFAGYQEKDFVIMFLKSLNAYKITFLIISAITTVYISRAFFTVFIQNSSKTVPDKPDLSMNLSILALGIMLIIMSVCLPYPMPTFELIIPVLILTTVGVIYYKKRNLYKIPILYKLSYNGFYADCLLRTLFVKPYLLVVLLSLYIEKSIINLYKYTVRLFFLTVNLFNLVEKYIMNQITIEIPIKSVKFFSMIYSKLQNGNTQSYICYAILVFTVVLTGLLFVYKYILHNMSGGL